MLQVQGRLSGLYSIASTKYVSAERGGGARVGEGDHTRSGASGVDGARRGGLGDEGVAADGFALAEVCGSIIGVASHTLLQLSVRQQPAHTMHPAAT